MGLTLLHRVVHISLNYEYESERKTFIQFFVVETQQFVGRFVTVILMRRNCGQRSSWAAESKR